MRLEYYDDLKDIDWRFQSLDTVRVVAPVNRGGDLTRKARTTSRKLDVRRLFSLQLRIMLRNNRDLPMGNCDVTLVICRYGRRPSAAAVCAIIDWVCEICRVMRQE